MQSTLEVKIRALVEGLAQIQALSTQLTSVGGAASDVSSGAKAGASGLSNLHEVVASMKSDLGNLNEAMTQIGGSLSSLGGYAKAAFTAFLAFTGVLGVKAAADVAAKTQTLGVTLDIVGKNAGYSTEALQAYEKQVIKTGITTQAARQAILQMVQAGLDLGDASDKAGSKVAQLAKTAQNLAVVTGQNSSDTLTTLITNISQLDTEGLRWMGIVVDMDAAQAKFAQSIGKSAGALTQAEKQQAAFNAVQEKAKGLAGAYDAAMDTVGKKISSLKRYQEEAARSIGESLLPAYGAMVDMAGAFLKKVFELSEALNKNTTIADSFGAGVKSALEVVGTVFSKFLDNVLSLGPAFLSMKAKLEEAFTGFDGGDMMAVLNDISSLAKGIASAVMDALGEAAPSFRLVADAGVMVKDSFVDAAKEVVLLAISFTDGVDAGKVLSTVLQGLGLMVAGFADGLTVIKGVAEIMSAGVLVGFGAIANVIGDITSVFFPKFSAGLKAIGDRALEMGMRAAESGRKTFEGFADGETYVAKYAAKLAELPAAHEKENEAAQKAAASNAAAYKQAEDSVLAYVRAVEKQTLKGEASAKAYAELRTKVAELAKEHGFSQKQVEDLATRLDNAKDKSQDLTETFKKLKTTEAEFRTETSNTGKAGAEAFNELVKSGKYAADKLYSAFSKGLGMETTINGLETFKQAADQAYKDGKLGLTEYQGAVQLLNSKFMELFQTSLKSAKTKEDFKQLKDQVVELGAKGTLSGELVATALSQIKEKATGAGESMVRAAQQSTQLSQASLSIANQQVSVAQAGLNVSKAETEVIRAKLNVARTGTEESKADLAVKQANLEVARAMQQAALAQLQLELQMYAQRRAEQEYQSAQKASERDPGNAALRYAVETTREKAEAEQVATESARRNAQAQQENAAEAQKAAIAAQSQAEALQQAGEEAKGLNQTYSVSNYALLAVHNTAKDMEEALKGAGYAGKGLSETAAGLAERFKGGINSLDDWWYKMDGIYKSVRDSVEMSKKLEEQAQSLRDHYSEVKNRISDAEAGIKGMGGGMSYMGSASTAVQDAMREIKRDAASVASSAKDAALQFISSSRSIHEELLTAQGDEMAASKSRFDSRKKELELEYQMLQLKIQSARIQAQAAGVSTSVLDKAASEASAGYQQAKADLEKLAKLDEAKIAQSAADKKKAEQDAIAKDKQDALNKAAEEATAKKSAQESEAQAKLAKEKEASDKAAKARQDAADKAREDSQRQAANDSYRASSSSVGALAEQQKAADSSVADERINSLDEYAAASARISNDALSQSMSNDEKSHEARLAQITKEFAIRRSFEESLSGMVVKTSTGVLQPIAQQSAAAERDAYLRPVEVAQVTLDFGGKRVDVYTNPGKSGDLLDALTDLKKRTGS